jgi:prepilin-type N-terminal cleavage/methylation domain-containing protein
MSTIPAKREQAAANPPHPRHRARRDGAFSMIELLIAAALLSVVIAAAGAMLLQAFGNEVAYRQQNNTQVSGRSAADAISDDIRGATGSYFPVYPGTFTTVTGSAITKPAGNSSWTSPFTFTVANDTGVSRNVRYWLAANGGAYNLMRQVDANTDTNAGVTIAQNVDPTTFSVSYSSTTTTATVDVTSLVGTAPQQSNVRVRVDVIVRNNLPTVKE